MPEIVFLNKPQPLVGKVADWLVEGISAPPWDFSDTAILLPTGGAGRRLRWELVKRAEQAGTGILPPLTIAPMAFLDLCVSGAVADRQQRLAAWARALHERAGEAASLLPGFAEPLLLRDALRIADSLAEVCALLAEGGLTPRSEEVARLLVHDEDRWRQINLLYTAYLDALDGRGLADPNEARLAAVAHPQAPEGIRRVVVAGVGDLNGLARRFLDALAAGGVPVTVLVDAPDCAEARFDAWGCPDEEYWAQAALPVRLEDVVVVADAWSEGETAAALAVPSRAAVCLADERLVPQATAALARRGCAVFDPAGQSLAVTEVAVLVEGWRRFCETQLVADLRVPVECPAFQQGIAAHSSLSGDAVQEAFDTIQRETLIDFWPDVLAHYRGLAGTREAEFVALVEQWRKAFPLKKPRRSLPEFLERLHGGVQVEESSAEAAALRAYGEVLGRRFAGAAEEPETDWALLSDAVRATVLYGDHPPDAVELNGWLEAAWLPEEFVVLTGCAEGVLPSVTTGHPFLPESARRTLGLPANAARLARDAHLLHCLLASRPPGAVKCLHARQNADGEPAKPSRLFFRCPENDLAPRVRALFREVPSLRDAPARQRGWQLDVPRREPPAVIPVTGFGDYLACPMRYYFKYVLRLDGFDAAAREMDAREFGDIFHRVVEAFAKDGAVRDSTAVPEIEQCVLGHLDAMIARQYGRRPSLPVRVQQESLRARLRQFARLQAEERAAGWRIVEAELPFRVPETLVLGGLSVTAKLDRIEVHEGTGRRRILDYKTYGRDKTPEKVHLGPPPVEDLLPGEEVLWGGKMRCWKNLQLPLYRALAQLRWPDEEPPLVGYFLLPERVEDSRIEEFPLDEATARAAVQCATEIAGLVRRGIFWPPRTPLYDDYEGWFLDEHPAAVLSAGSVAFLSGGAA